MSKRTTSCSTISVAEAVGNVRKTGPLASFLVVCGLLLVAACAPAERPLSYSGQTMGTSYQVTVVAAEDGVPGDLGERIQAVLDDVDGRMSTYKDDSELNRLNRAPPGEPFRVSPQLMAVLQLSQQVYQLSGGAFDPSVGPLVDLWGFGPSHHPERIPDQAEIDGLRGKSGFHQLILDPEGHTATRQTDISLDLSAVAKGYGADRVAELLRTLGLTRYMVEVGGEMALAGLNARGTPWRIAVERPVVEAREVEQVISVTDAGVATSGDYRNYFEQDGVRYSHTLDPRDGYPVSHNLASVTVVGATSALADALATAYLVMGTAQALAHAEANQVAIMTLSKGGDGFEEAHSPAFTPYLIEVQ